jgi:hypothetical protein
MSTVQTETAQNENIISESNHERVVSSDEFEVLIDSEEDLQCAEIVKKHETKYGRQVSKPKKKPAAVKASRKS